MKLASIASIILASVASTHAFTTSSFGVSTVTANPTASKSTILHMSDDEFTQETPEQAQKRIQGLVDDNPVLLFMKGSKIFPQCGFSNTATQILQSYGIDFHTVDVLADESIR